ncbi:hypothetical protein [Bacteroides sp.]
MKRLIAGEDSFSTQYGRTIHPASSEPLPAMVGTSDAYRPNL